MITKERLEELIKQEAKVYYIGFDTIEELIVDDFGWRIDDDNNLWQGLECYINIADLYETKEEAEFVAKNHDTRIEKFEPPFELKQYENYEFISQNCDVGVCLIRHLNGYYVCNYDNYVDKFFNTYQEAVDYAHKLFNGEE